MITKFTSIKTVFAKVYRDSGINYEIPEVDMIEWVAEAMGKIGAYMQYKEVSECLDLTDGKVKLPACFHKLVDIHYNHMPMYWATNTNAMNYQCENCSIPCNDNGMAARTFYINDSYIITNIDTPGSICVVYLAVLTDDEGFPMVPSDEYFLEATSKYIIYMHLTGEWMKGKIPDKVYDKFEKEWLFYVGAASGAANMPNTAQIENLKNIFRRILPITNDYSRSFKNYNKQERFNNQ